MKVTLEPTLPHVAGPDGKGRLWVGVTENGELVGAIVTGWTVLEGRPAPRFMSWLRQHAPLRGLLGGSRRWSIDG